MRAGKLITISTVAVLMGGTSLAIGGGGSLQSGASTQGPAAIEQGSPRSSETKVSRPGAGERLMRRGEMSSERGSKIEGSRALQRGGAMTTERGRTLKGERGQAMAAERGRVITGERGQAITGERGLAMTTQRGRAATGQQPKAAAQIQGRLGSQTRQSFAQKAPGGPVYARASAREASVALRPEQRTRLREIVTARQDIPRISNLTGVRVNALVPRNVRLAAIPDELARMYPRFRRHQAFIYRNELVVVDPATSRIVAVLPA